MATLVEQPVVGTGRTWGGQSMVAPLRRVLVRWPAPPASDQDYLRFGYPRPVDHDRAVREHGVFRTLLEEAGAEVIVAGPDADGLLDAIFAYDPSLTTDMGAILLRPGKAARLPEVELAEQTYAELGIPIVGWIEAPGTAEGGDMLWLDEATASI
jgi:dimethylargininase